MKNVDPSNYSDRCAQRLVERRTLQAIGRGNGRMAPRCIPPTVPLCPCRAETVLSNVNGCDIV